MWSAYIDVAIRHALDEGMRGLDALAYFMGIWGLPQPQAAYAAALYMGKSPEKAREEVVSHSDTIKIRKATPRPSSARQEPNKIMSMYKFLACDPETMEQVPEQNVEMTGSTPEEAASKLAESLRSKGQNVIMGKSGRTVFGDEYCYTWLSSAT
jgi:hypothetical protein